MQFEDIIMDYFMELEALYKAKISTDPTFIDSDKQSHAYTYSCSSRVVRERHR
ncbi:hypothetical protein BH18THE2_BH18THE2_26550 [soil metagenome]